MVWEEVEAEGDAGELREENDSLVVCLCGSRDGLATATLNDNC